MKASAKAPINRYLEAALY